jgi:hypothetical protein
MTHHLIYMEGVQDKDTIWDITGPGRGWEDDGRELYYLAIFG